MPLQTIVRYALKIWEPDDDPDTFTSATIALPSEWGSHEGDIEEIRAELEELTGDGAIARYTLDSIVSSDSSPADIRLWLKEIRETADIENT